MPSIGVFDSGLGGLSVAGRIINHLPDEPITYFADNAHVPYGERPLEEIRDFALAITGFLIDRGAKAVVMACNMSSAVALDAARKAYPGTPILGVVRPGARAAARRAGEGPIGILATTGTVKSGAYVQAIKSFDDSAVVVQQPCPRFVPLVEEGKADTEEAEETARECAVPLIQAGVRTVVLGCTHYPFLARAIASAFGPDVAIVDPAEETVAELGKLLLGGRLRAWEGQAPAAPGTGSGGPSPSQPSPSQVRHRFFASGDPEGFAELGSRFLGRRITAVERAAWGIDIGKVLV